MIYAYLGEYSTPSVIIVNEIHELEENKLLEFYGIKIANGWSITDIRDIIPLACMHKIPVEDDYKPSVENQCKLNPSMKGVV